MLIYAVLCMNSVGIANNATLNMGLNGSIMRPLHRFDESAI